MLRFLFAKRGLTFIAVVGGREVKRFTLGPKEVMSRSWMRFNKYANDKGYNKPIGGAEYLDVLGWSNGTEVMQLILIGTWPNWSVTSWLRRVGL